MLPSPMRFTKIEGTSVTVGAEWIDEAKAAVRELRSPEPCSLGSLLTCSHDRVGTSHAPHTLLWIFGVGDIREKTRWLLR
jgi:hypothetical protein